ncbi:hypothetical protein ACH4SP_14730 [Streptomyces sp. NPDC021093]|uniref:hypothetical protein n=1 Tax=Streptomyces sp. NPDC021093 TaxID=3365112 RepID=UPI0037AF0540
MRAVVTGGAGRTGPRSCGRLLCLRGDAYGRLLGLRGDSYGRLLDASATGV